MQMVVERKGKSKLKDVIIESTNLRTDEHLYEFSRGTAIVNIIPVLSSLVDIPSSCALEKFIRIFVSIIKKNLEKWS